MYLNDLFHYFFEVEISGIFLGDYRLVIDQGRKIEKEEKTSRRPTSEGNREYYMEENSERESPTN